jgi:hypothetical protein
MTLARPLMVAKFRPAEALSGSRPYRSLEGCMAGAEILTDAMQCHRNARWISGRSDVQLAVAVPNPSLRNRIETVIFAGFQGLLLSGLCLMNAHLLAQCDGGADPGCT